MPTDLIISVFFLQKYMFRNCYTKEGRYLSYTNIIAINKVITILECTVSYYSLYGSPLITGVVLFSIYSYHSYSSLSSISLSEFRVIALAMQMMGARFLVLYPLSSILQMIPSISYVIFVSSALYLLSFLYRYKLDFTACVLSEIYRSFVHICCLASIWIRNAVAYA